MIFRWPDNPRRAYAEFLHEADKSNDKWFAFKKWDGWRRPAYNETDGWKFYAKATKGEEAAAQPPPDMVDELRSLNLPAGTALDQEWMGRRANSGNHLFVVLDMLYWKDKWMGDVPLIDRLFLVQQCLSIAKSKGNAPRVVFAPFVTSDFCSYYEKQKGDPESEGVVIKRSNSKLVGGMHSCQDNLDWWKIKFR